MLRICGDDGVLRFPSEDAAGILMDACIYGWLVEGRTVIESFRLRRADS